MKSGEAHLEAAAISAELSRIYDEEVCGPFPSEGCRWLMCEFGASDDLTSDLDLWFSDVAGLSSRGKKLLHWSVDDVSSARGVASLGFFDKHPQYAIFERHFIVERGSI